MASSSLPEATPLHCARRSSSGNKLVVPRAEVPEGFTINQVAELLPVLGGSSDGGGGTPLKPGAFRRQQAAGGRRRRAEQIGEGPEGVRGKEHGGGRGMEGHGGKDGEGKSARGESSKAARDEGGGRPSEERGEGADLEAALSLLGRLPGASTAAKIALPPSSLYTNMYEVKYAKGS